MRVTANTFPSALVDQLSQLSVKQNRLQNQAATGQRIRYPEDDPSAMRRMLDLQTENKGAAQYLRNISNLRDQAQSTYEVARGLKKISDRAGELAILADGTKSQEELKLYAVEVTHLIKQAAALANTKFRGDFLLSGTRSDRQPYDLSIDTLGNVTAVQYEGNSSVAESEISDGMVVSANVIGANTTGSGPRGLLEDSRFGADLFNHLISLQDHLLAGDTDAIVQTDIQQLRADEENFLVHFGSNGAVQAQLNVSEMMAEKRSDNLGALMSKEVDADLAESLVLLTQTQNAYTAALQSGAKILSSTLLDYLR